MYTKEQCENPCPVHEYLLHASAPEEEYDEEGEGELEEELPIILENDKPETPFFLTARNGPRVVEFYSPWCGQCQNLKHRYISIAKEVKSRISESQSVEFYAVSCSAYDHVCEENEITKYPTIKAYVEGSMNGSILKELTPENIAKAVNVKLDKISESDKTSGNAEVKQGRVIDILGASADGYRRLKKETFSDAALAFTYALRNDIYKSTTKGYASLTETEKQVFVEWIDLLYWTLPPTWRLHTLLNDLRSDINGALAHRDTLLRMVDHQYNVVNEFSLLLGTTWSSSCTHENTQESYTCGLWNILHVVSVGVAERYKAVLGSRSRVTVSHAANSLRDYIQHFLSCTSCQESFLNVYDTCGFDSCKRFHKSYKTPSESSWKELALWLWEFHNEVNVIKLKHGFIKKYSREPSLTEINEVMWPSRKNCNYCWLQDGKWDKEAIYLHLKKEYWPGGVQNFRYIVLDTKPNEIPQGYDLLKRIKIIFAFFVFASSLWIFFKKARLRKTGKHKKRDDRNDRRVY